jgi:SWI/SNF-related matrix-associated actin-dependent regulator 1 of chromatin subfamily A
MRGEIMVRIGVLKNISARGKLTDVIEYVSNVIDSGEKIVLFTHLREVQETLKKFFPDAVTIFGSDNNAERQRNIDAFQKDPKVQLIICSIKAAGVGITLTASSNVAFVELPWHPADCEQAEDRCHRIGQINSVQCLYFLGKNTIDEWIYQLINEKREMSNQITGARNDVEEKILDGLINILSK